MSHPNPNGVLQQPALSPPTLRAPQTPQTPQTTRSPSAQSSTANLRKQPTPAPVKKSRTFFKRSPTKDFKNIAATVSEFRTRRKTTLRSQKAIPPFWKRITYFGWWWEVGGIFVGLVCTCLTVAILFWTDGKALSEWNLPIQPNSFISVFSTVGKSAIMVPIAEGISQLKWSHLEEPAPRLLSSMQYFDDASRGPWGAMMLLWKGRVRSPPWLALLGSIITLLLLGYEPFTQQILEFPTRLAPVHGKTGSVSYIHALPNQVMDPTLDTRESRVGFAVGIRGALFNMSEAVPTNAKCDTQECQLPDFESLATCFTCETEEFDLEEAQHWRPDGVYDAGCDFTARIPGKDYYQVDSLEDVLEALKGQNASDFETSWAANCRKERAGYPKIVMNLSAIVDGPIATPDLLIDYDNSRDYVAGKIGRKSDYSPWTADDTLSYCHVQHPEDIGSFVPIQTIYPATCFTLTSNMSDFATINMVSGKLKNPIKGKIDWCRHNWCAKRYEQVTVKNGIMNAGKITKFPLHSVKNFTKTIPEGWDNYYDLVADSGTDQVFTIGKAARNRAYALTSLKDLGDMYFVDDKNWARADWEGLFNATESTFSTMIQSRKNEYHKIAAGQAYGEETFVKVRWEWYIMPLSCVLATTAFLLLTAIQSAKKPYLYKTSFIATLFHGLEGWTKDEMRSQTKWRKQETGWDLLKVAEKSRAKFGRNADGDLKILKAD